ncbi:DUF58 domain-containing protein [Thermostaphylospora chromogena]|uniref:DUF58 domain-containing protein n=1 Tax=Thermostaphylospora chromogena TaxID=35622 RepID=A0A1H1FRX1_9ACTN|nr:DUF58 domain-containing protein [Thermostaphylospora chromogena]SDR03641.1 Protein of unknown function DUF58 [Thermostaphylospora chromogena]
MRHLISEPALRRLELTITRRLDGLLQGEYRGLAPGPGSEPAEARPYEPGDDVRRMDWNVTARSMEPHVRDLIADRELETWVLLDASASMDFGTARMEKRELALAAVAAVGFLTERTGNRIGAYILHGDGVRRLPARTGRAHLMALLHLMFALPRSAAGAPVRPLGAHAEMLARTRRRRGLVVVVSDFLEDPSSWERPLRNLTLRHQVLAVEVIDPRELDLPDVGILTVIDPETGRRREVPTADARLRRRYAEAAAAQRDAIEAALRRTGAAHLRLRTDRDWVKDLVRHLLAQRRLAAAAPTTPSGGGPRIVPGPQPRTTPGQGGGAA